MKHISERENQLPDAIIGQMLEIAAQRKDIISLGPGEPDFPAPRAVVEWTKKFAGMCNHYSPPGGRKELKEAIVKKLRKDNRIRCAPENIIVTAGSQEALLLALQCTADVNEQVLIPDPGFLGYKPTVELTDASPVPYPLREESSWEIDIDEIRRIADKKKMHGLIINSPSNPTGNVLSRKTLEEIADFAVEYDIYVFSDEAYEKIIYGKKHVSIGNLNGMEDYVITLQTFSKSFAMCGYRLGYCAAPEEIIRAMTKTHVYSTICAPTISQIVGVKALGIGIKYTKTMVKEYKRRRDMIVRKLNETGLRTVRPEGAFYAFANIQDFSKNSFRFAQELLKKAKVAVIPGSEFGRNGEGYIRCSFATDYRLIEQAMQRMESFLGRPKYKNSASQMFR